jgi:HD superfamily phosphodiesterase
MKFTRQIESAEKQYLQILEEFFISVYDEKTLSSHGIEHHRRVWKYSKELLKILPLTSTRQTSRLAAELIIACYMHDVGMSVDPGVKHGKYSRELCSRFLSNNHMPRSEWDIVLEAIENHDNKDYTGIKSMNVILQVLSVADDLDAFGYIGIFRYSEIYLTRGTDPEKIGYMIRKNAGKRFENFIKTFGSESEIVQKHKKRYEILDEFFSKYNEQLPSYHFGTRNPSGICGVIEIILFMMNNGLKLKDFLTGQENYTKEPGILLYFSELASELLVEHTVL